MTRIVWPRPRSNNIPICWPGRAHTRSRLAALGRLRGGGRGAWPLRGAGFVAVCHAPSLEGWQWTMGHYSRERAKGMLKV